MSKYKASPLYYSPQTHQVLSAKEAKGLNTGNLFYFASKHEFSVYQTLLPLTYKYSLRLQSPIELVKPNLLSTYPNGRMWIADFELRDEDSTLMVIEAKGVLTKDFSLVLALLELNNQEFFNNLWLVFPKSHLRTIKSSRDYSKLL